MAYRVRNPDGEIQFDSFDALQDAYAKHLVEADDEVLEEGSTQWRRAGSLPKLVGSREQRPSLLQGPARWYLMAAAVFLVGAGLILVLSHGVLGFVVAFGVALLMSGVFTWMAARRRR